MTRVPRRARRVRCAGGAVVVVGIVTVALAAGFARCAHAVAAPSPTPAALEIGAHERLLVVAPHPDDEVLGAGGLVQRVIARGGTVDVALVTAGDGYPDAVRGATGRASPAAEDFVGYGARRIAEARAALDTLGGAAGRVRATVLGFPDGALASLRGEHWSRSAPARSATTNATAPPFGVLVADAAAPYAGEVLLDALVQVVRLVRPTIVALPDPLDVHPDHATAGLFALAALCEAHSDARVLAYLVHWPSWPPGWDASAIDPAATERGLDLPDDLPRRGSAVRLELSGAERDVKRDALARHATQQRQMAVYLDAFVRPQEPYTLLGAGAANDARAVLRAAPAAP